MVYRPYKTPLGRRYFTNRQRGISNTHMAAETTHPPSDKFTALDESYMHIALTCAAYGATLGEVPVGAVLVADNKLLATGFNQPIFRCDATAHAEIIALRQACRRLNNYRLPKNSCLYVTLEPCTMCVGALIHARLNRLIFATTEPRAGAVVSQNQLITQTHFNHTIHIQQGLLQQQSSQLLKQFFKAKR